MQQWNIYKITLIATSTESSLLARGVFYSQNGWAKLGMKSPRTREWLCNHSGSAEFWLLLMVKSEDFDINLEGLKDYRIDYTDDSDTDTDVEDPFADMTDDGEED